MKGRDNPEGCARQVTQYSSSMSKSFTIVVSVFSWQYDSNFGGFRTQCIGIKDHFTINKIFKFLVNKRWSLNKAGNHRILDLDQTLQIKLDILYVRESEVE